MAAHVHTYRRIPGLVWDGYRFCRSFFCTSCPVGATSARIVPVGQPGPTT